MPDFRPSGAFRWRLGTLLLVAGLAAILAGCAGRTPAPTTTLTLGEDAVLAARVVDTTPEGAVLVRTESGRDLLLPEGLTFLVADEEVRLGDLTVGSRVGIPLQFTDATLVALNDRVLVLRDRGRLVEVPVEALPPAWVSRTKVRVQKPNGTVVEVPLQAALAMQETQGAVVLGSGIDLSDVAVGWSPGLVERAVVVGPVGTEHVLVLAPVGGEVRLVNVPLLAARDLVRFQPLQAVALTAASGALQVEPWVAAAATAALVLDGDLRLAGVVSDVNDTSLLLVADDQAILLPRTVSFLADGRTVAFTDLGPGMDVVAIVPPTTLEILALTDHVLTVESPEIGFLQVPVGALPTSLLSHTRVTVPNPAGHRVTVPLTAALNMARQHGGAILLVEDDRLRTLRAGMAGQGVLLGSRDGSLLLLTTDGGQMALSRIPLAEVPGDLPFGSPVAFVWTSDGLEVHGWGTDRAAREIRLELRADEEAAEKAVRREEAPGRKASPPGQEIAPARPESPPGQAEPPGRRREGAPGPGVAPGRQDGDREVSPAPPGREEGVKPPRGSSGPGPDRGSSGRDQGKGSSGKDKGSSGNDGSGQAPPGNDGQGRGKGR